MLSRLLIRGPIVIAALAAVMACGHHPAAPDPDTGTGLTPVPSTAEWPSATPSAERLDGARLGDLVMRIRRGDYGKITSLLISRHGRLAVEEYFNGWSADVPHTMQSVTKSVTALLLGVAVQSGQLNLDDRAENFFPDYQPIANNDSRKLAMTVRDIVTMRSGFDWDESVYAGSPLERLNNCKCDWLRFMLDWPMRDSPGARFQYDGGSTILLGGIIGRAAHSRLDTFASSTLFSQLGTSGDFWIPGLPDGLPHAGGGLFMRPRDMAKIAAVMLGGSWRGRQVLNQSWISLVSTRVTRGTATWSGHAFDYGYGWWMSDYNGDDLITASGVLGQWIFVDPSLALAVAVTGENDETKWTAPVEFVYSHVLPAASR